MATIKKKASQNEQNIVDLVFELKKLEPKKASASEIKSMKANIEDFKRQNKKVSSRISYLKKKIEKSEPTDIAQLAYYEELDRFKKKGMATHKDRAGNEVKLVKYDIRHMKNELNKAEGKDFYYRINDGFNKRYNVKRSEILKMDDSSFFINKMRGGVEEEIKKLKAIKNRDKRQNKKLSILEDKLMKTIKFNQKLIKYGNVDESDLPDKFRSSVNRAFDINKEKDEKEGEYPIIIFIGEEYIEF